MGRSGSRRVRHVDGESEMALGWMRQEILKGVAWTLSSLFSSSLASPDFSLFYCCPQPSPPLFPHCISPFKSTDQSPTLSALLHRQNTLMDFRGGTISSSHGPLDLTYVLLLAWGRDTSPFCSQCGHQTLNRWWKCH